jgi:hydroxyacylglutathione hydrolase
MKVGEQLYIYLWNDNRENNCNSIFIDGKVPLLVDPGHLHRTSALFDRMKADGVDPARIRAVIATHAHPDHFEGSLAFKDHGVKIAISQREDKYVEEIGLPTYLQQGLTAPEYRVDFYLQEGDLLLGRHEFQIIFTPGHSPGSISIYWPRYKTLLPGDVVFMQSVGRSDFAGGDAKILKQSVERLAKLRVDLLVPGHGPAIQGRERVQSNFDFVKRMFFSA